jgi:hypothetical protein
MGKVRTHVRSSPRRAERTMTEKQTLQGVPGILRPFKAYIEQSKIDPGSQIVYYGVPGTCTPFVELLGFAIRDLHLAQVFVPYVDESRAKKIIPVVDTGMQIGEPVPVDNPKVVVVMGGLSMPNVPVTSHQMKEILVHHDSAIKVGVCFMRMFEKAGWLEDISFDLLIDANIDPVEVWQ